MKKKIFMILLLLLPYCTLIAQNTIVVRKQDNLKRGKSSSNVRASNKANYPYSIPLQGKEGFMGNFNTRLESITLYNDMTIVMFTIKDSWGNNLVSSNKTAYIEDVDTKRKYFIQDSDIGIGKHQAQPHGNDWTYSETYPALPRTTRYINVFNGKVLSLKKYKLW